MTNEKTKVTADNINDFDFAKMALEDLEKLDFGDAEHEPLTSERIEDLTTRIGNQEPCGPQREIEYLKMKLLLTEVKAGQDSVEKFDRWKEAHRSGFRYMNVAYAARELMNEHASDIPEIAHFLEKFEDMLEGKAPIYEGHDFVVMNVETGETDG